MSSDAVRYTLFHSSAGQCTFIVNFCFYQTLPPIMPMSPSKSNLNKLQRVQNYLTHVVLKCHTLVSSNGLFSRTSLVTHHRINFKLATLTFKAHCSQLPPHLLSLLYPPSPGPLTLHVSSTIISLLFPGVEPILVNMLSAFQVPLCLILFLLKSDSLLSYLPLNNV